MIQMESTFQLGLGFFGLTSETSSQSKISIYKQIHQICFHGKGGYSWNEVYNMPIWLRRFIFSEMKNYYDDEKKSAENSQSNGTQTVIDSSGKVKTPEFLSKAVTSKRPIKYK